MKFKVIVDTLSSIAAFIAIVSVMASWYRSSRKPLKVDRVVLHKKSDDITFIIVIKNRNAYPVTINRSDCYKRKKYEVQKKHGGKPEFSEFYSGSEMLFTCKETFEIQANANTDIRINMAAAATIPPKLLFLFQTSHGPHELRCKDVSVVEFEKLDVYGLEYKLDYKHKYKAKTVYYWKKVKELTSALSRRQTDLS